MELIKKYQAKYGIFDAVIEEDLPEVGFNLYVWKNGIGHYDNVQYTLKICQEDAFEEFGIPLDSWVEVTEE